MTVLSLLLCTCFALAQTTQPSVGLPPATTLQANIQTPAGVLGTITGTRALCCIANAAPPKVAFFNTKTPGSMQVVDSLSEFITGAVFLDGKYYALFYNSKELFVVDTVGGVRTMIDTLVVPDGGWWTGMAYDPTTGTTYGVSTTISSSTLYRINLQTGAVTVVAPVNLPAIISIAISSGGQMYAVDIVKDSLFAIDKQNGSAYGIGPIGFDANFAQDLCFDHSTGVLYYASSNTSAVGELRTVNVATGATTLVGPFQGNQMVDGFTLLNQSPTWAKRCALIYDPTSSDSVDSRTLATFLNANGFTTRRIPVTAVATTDLRPFHVVIVSSGSGSSSQWGTTGAVTALSACNRPVIGIGEGGYAAFGKLGLPIGYPQGMHGSDTAIKVLDPTLPLFLSPYDLTLNSDSTCRLYQSWSPSIQILLGSTPAGVVKLGASAGSPVYFPLVQYGSRYLLWGMDDMPEKMTVDGQHLFLNAVVAMAEQYVTGQVAYIHGSDHSVRDAFKALFAANGLGTTFVDTSNVASFDFAPYTAIVVDKGTGAWTNAARWNRVATSGRSIVGVGEGGSYLFERMGLWISYGNTMWTSGSSIYVTDLSLPVMHNPASVAVQEDSTSTLYNSGSSVVTLYTGGGVPPDVTLIGRAQNYSNYYAVASQAGHYFWGFTQSPDLMTEAGRNLFMNVLFAAEKPVLTSAQESAQNMPEQFALAQNYPNPFNPSTVIVYTIGDGERGRGGEGGKSVSVQLTVYDILGRQVAVLVNEMQKPGRYQVRFNGAGLASGVYFCRMTAGTFSATRKLMLTK